VKVDKETLLAKQQLEGMKLGHQVGHSQAQLEQQRRIETNRMLSNLVKTQQQRQKVPPKKDNK